MTTIVVDRKVGFIAADRRFTSNDCDVIMDDGDKIRKVKVYGHTHYLASCGYESTSLIAEDWYENGDPNERPDPIDTDEDTAFTTVILTHDSRILLLDRYLRPYEIHHRFYAVGSGGPFAWAVLEAGCGIEKAMRTAIKMDGGSGAPFEVAYLSGEHEVYE